VKKTYVISDTHFGHRNILTYTDRPFNCVDDMNVHLLERWRDTIDYEDDVYFLGDFAFGKDVTDLIIYDLFLKLLGNVYFLLGNHDLPKKQWGLTGVEEILKNSPNFDIYRHINSPNSDIDEQEELVSFRIIPSGHQIMIGNQKFELSHHPRKERFKKNIIYLHGHSHAQHSLTNIDTSIANRNYDVGVDMYGGPVELTEDLRYLNNPQGWQIRNE